MSHDDDTLAPTPAESEIPSQDLLFPAGNFFPVSGFARPSFIAMCSKGPNRHQPAYFSIHSNPHLPIHLVNRFVFYMQFEFRKDRDMLKVELRKYSFPEPAGSFLEIFKVVFTLQNQSQNTNNYKRERK